MYKNDNDNNNKTFFSATTRNTTQQFANMFPSSGELQLTTNQTAEEGNDVRSDTVTMKKSPNK
jgi:hypothetical protein